VHCNFTAIFVLGDFVQLTWTVLHVCKIYPRAVYQPVETRPTAKASERRVRESSQGETVDGEGAIPRRDSERITMEYSHGNTASGWRESVRIATDRVCLLQHSLVTSHCYETAESLFEYEIKNWRCVFCSRDIQILMIVPILGTMVTSNCNKHVHTLSLQYDSQILFSAIPSIQEVR